MKTLILGGIKSGKSRFAEHYALKGSTTKPYYLATTEFIDDEMRLKIEVHRNARNNTFTTIEEPLQLYNSIKNIEGTVLVECLSMWLNNMLYHQKSDTLIFEEVEKLLYAKNDIIFVLNDVGVSVVSENALVRKFVDLSGMLSQKIASQCDVVYYVHAGLGQKLK